MSKQLMHSVSWLLVMAMFVLGIIPKVEAGFSPSEAIAVSQYDRTADLQRIQKILEMKMVSKRLEDLGLSQGEINAKLSRLDDEQIHQLATNIEDLRVGGDLGAVGLTLGFIILIVGVIYLVYTIVQIARSG